MKTYEYDRPNNVMRKEVDKVHENSRKALNKRMDEIRDRQQEEENKRKLH